MRKKLHQYLAWATLVFAFLAVLSSFFSGGSSDDATTTSGPITTIRSSTSSYVPRTYVVQAGDTMYSIAERFNLSAPEMVRLNNIKNPDRVPIGTTLMLPPSEGFVPIGATTTMPP